MDSAWLDWKQDGMEARVRYESLMERDEFAVGKANRDMSWSEAGNACQDKGLVKGCECYTQAAIAPKMGAKGSVVAFILRCQ